MLELNQLYNMDCMEGMKQFPDKYFELAIVDPPYGIGASDYKRGALNTDTVKQSARFTPQRIGISKRQRLNILPNFSGCQRIK
jgi:DNA modification methylase